MSLLQEIEQFGLADCDFNRKIWHFDTVIFPAAIDFIDIKAKPAVDPSAAIMAIFDSYEAGNSYFSLSGHFTKSGAPEIFTFKGV
jgi:hypothetical protein